MFVWDAACAAGVLVLFGRVTDESQLAFDSGAVTKFWGGESAGTGPGG